MISPAAVEQRPGVIIALVALLFLVAYTASLILLRKPDGRILLGDALHHYVQLRSAVFDGDLHFRNEYVRIYRLRGDEPGTEWVFEPTVTGHVRNLMPVGPALLWAPLFLVVSGGVWIANALGGNYAIDGFGRAFQATAGITGVIAAAAGVWLSLRMAMRIFPARAAIWSALVLWLASPAVYYSVISPTYSHAASLLATSAFWYFFVSSRESAGTRRYVVLGALAGISALMRWQDAIVLAAVAVDLMWRLRRELTIAQVAARGTAAVVAAIIAFSPQMIVWQTLYAQPFAIPQGGGFMRWTEPALWAVLFSDWHGLFTWTPVVFVAVVGLPLLWRRDALIGSAAMLFFLLSWWVNAAVADWWAGEAFGSRRFVSCFPIFVLGLSALIARWNPSRAAIATASTIVVAHTFLLLVQYQAFMHGLRDVVPYPRGAYNLWLARFVVPFDLAREWLSR